MGRLRKAREEAQQKFARQTQVLEQMKSTAGELANVTARWNGQLSALAELADSAASAAGGRRGQEPERRARAIPAGGGLDGCRPGSGPPAPARPGRARRGRAGSGRAGRGRARRGGRGGCCPARYTRARSYRTRTADRLKPSARAAFWASEPAPKVSFWGRPPRVPPSRHRTVQDVGNTPPRQATAERPGPWPPRRRPRPGQRRSTPAWCRAPGPRSGAHLVNSVVTPTKPRNAGL
jgi:hypothetical protein